MLVGNVIGGCPSTPKTVIFQTEGGEEMYAVLVGSEKVFTATANDIRKGKVAATDVGVVTGTKDIPDYTHVYAQIKTDDGMCLGVFAGTNEINSEAFIKIPVYDTNYVSKYYINNVWYEDSAGTIPWTSSSKL